jgi:hypothetical protein
MKRIIKVLVVAALMVVLMAANVSPAFAVREADLPPKGDGKGWGPSHGYASGITGEEPHYGGTDECLQGWATNNPNKDGYSYYCRGN